MGPKKGKTKKPRPSEPAAPDLRCVECGHCLPDEEFGGGEAHYCRARGEALSPSRLWRPACAEFEPLAWDEES